ncbi:MAG: LytR family transcriptional regulator [Solirubrobacterales bacterium]|nr:LytR family transcriptional regulator [Solirubrobacterales bacterium]
MPRAGAPLYKRFAIAGALIFFLTTGAVATAALLEVKQLAKNLTPIGPPVKFEPDVITKADAGQPQTILLIGSDKRFGAGKGDARSDTMMLVRLDPDQAATAVMSIPRDLVTAIPGYGTEKINAAYSHGGLNLTVKTVKQLLTAAGAGEPFKINHAIGVSFKGFRKVVNFLDCVYTDVDRRYYHSNAGLPPSAQYAEIDIQPGYQRLCGQRALDYVRFRHADSDLVRAARQQDFLRQAKDQIGTSRLLDDLNPLTKIFGQSTESDRNLTSVPGILRILKLAAYSAGHPVREIQFPATFVDGDPRGLGSYITATPDEIARAVDEFLHAKPESKPRATGPKKPVSAATKRQVRKSARKAPTSYAKYDLVLNRRLGEDLVAPVEAKGKLRFPLYFAKAMTPSGRYPTSTPNAPMPRVYTIRDRADKPHQAYRIVVTHNEAEGQYYGVQGTTWKNPPILDGGSQTLRMRGRTYELRYDGKRLRTIAWRTSKATYWVSNTLSLKLSNMQMRGLARSLTKLGDP